MAKKKKSQSQKSEAEESEVKEYDAPTLETESEPEIRRPVERWRQDQNTPASIFASAKAMHRWPEGRLLSEGEYELAVKAAAEEVIR